MTYACRTCDTTFTAPTDTDTVRCLGCGDMAEQQPAVSSPLPDQTALRARLAEAMAKRDGHPWPTEFEDDERDYYRRADAVLAVLPPPAARSATLLDAATSAERLPIDQRYVHHGQLCDAWDDGREAVVRLLRRLAAEAQQQESGSGCAHCVCCHAWGDREAHAALVRDDGAEAPQPETCRNCQGSGLDPRYNGEYACPDCSAGAPQPDTETRAPVPQPDVCDTCDTERCETCHGCRCNMGDDNTCGHPDCPATRVKHSGPETKFCVLCLSGEHERVDEPTPVPPVGYSGKGRVFCVACPHPADEDAPVTVNEVDPWELCPSCGRHIVDVARAKAAPAAAGPGRAADTHDDEDGDRG